LIVDDNAIAAEDAASVNEWEPIWMDTPTRGMAGDDDNGQRSLASGSGTPRYTRRLSDKILVAFHQSCDQGDFEVAEQLLHVLEMMLARRPIMPDKRRRDMEAVVAAHERLWHLRHPEPQETA
jgi:hypothetical protein